MNSLSSKQQAFINLMKNGEDYERRGFDLLLQRPDSPAFFDALADEGLFDPSRNSGPVEADKPGYYRVPPHQEHLPPDVGAAKLWLSRRQPERWKERQEVDFSGTLEHRLNQMTPEERAADAVELMARARRRLAEYRQTIEHEPSPEPETEVPIRRPIPFHCGMNAAM